MDSYAMLRDRTDVLVERYDNLVVDMVAAQGRRASSLPANEAQATDTSLDWFVELFQNVKTRYESHVLSVGLLALTKSGKSTFLNALLGEECMPSGTVPETARICRIIHDPELREPKMLDGDTTLQGATAVRQRLHELNSAVRERSQGADGEEEEILSISTSFPALATLTQTMPTALHLLDTPGPNEAGEEGLKHQVERLLDGIGVLVYLLDCSKLKTQEEKQMFQRLKEINPQLLKRLSDRLFFLVNKKDVLDDMSEDEVREYVAELVTEQMEDHDFQLDPRQVMLISAKTALYSRLVRSGRANEEQRTVFAKMAFGQAGYKRAIEAELLDVAMDMFEQSGFEAVEQRLLHFLCDHAGRLQLMGTVDDMTRHATQLMNVVAVCVAALERGVDEMASELAAMRAEMEGASQRFDEVRRSTEELQQQVTDDIVARLNELKDRLLLQVKAVLSKEKSPELLPSWERLWGDVQKTLKAVRSVPKNSPSAELEIHELLAGLYASINDQVGEEVRSFWHNLGSATLQHQQQLFDVLNQKLQELSREFESVVSERLDLQLEPSNNYIPPPSFSEFHHSLEHLLQSGVGRKKVPRAVEYEVVEKVTHSAYYVPVCRLGKYYFNRPESRTEVIKYVEMKLSVSIDKVKEFFIQHVEEMVKASIDAVGSYVRQYLAEQVESARKALDAYCASYHAVMCVALEEGSRGEEDRLAALARAKLQKEKLADLKSWMEELAGDLDQAREEEVEAEGVPERATTE